jgi:hypothetical protein
MQTIETCYIRYAGSYRMLCSDNAALTITPEIKSIIGYSWPSLLYICEES